MSNLLDRLYHGMLRIRIIEEQIAEMYTEWEMRCPTHLCIGQEGPAVGVCAALEKRDYVMGTHRSHGQYLAKGGDLNAFIAELYGKETGCCEGNGGSMHLIDLDMGFLGCVPIVGSTIPIATGVALAVKQRGEDRVVVPFFGDGSTEEGVFYESLNYAALENLPVVFACENNLYSVYTPIGLRQPERRSLKGIADSMGLAYGFADGNAPEEVYAVTQEAVARARSGEGPTLLEIPCYRWREHCGPNYDDDLGYRPEGELKHHEALCCVKRMEEKLLADGTLTPEKVASYRAEILEESKAAFRFAKESPFPPAENLYKHIYAPAVEGSVR